MSNYCRRILYRMKIFGKVSECVHICTYLIHTYTYALFENGVVF